MIIWRIFKEDQGSVPFLKEVGSDAESSVEGVLQVSVDDDVGVRAHYSRRLSQTSRQMVFPAREYPPRHGRHGLPVGYVLEYDQKVGVGENQIVPPAGRLSGAQALVEGDARVDALMAGQAGEQMENEVR